MFASLKNKIKEETGSDVLPLPVRLSSNSSRSLRGRLSSANSIASLDDMQILEQKEVEIYALRSQLTELNIKLTDLTKRVETLEEEKDRLEKTNEILLESVKVAQTQKDLICEEQEKIQNIQQAEIEKLKSLLSFREQEAVDRLSTIRQNQQQIENLTGELERLKIMEPMVEDIQESSSQDIKELKSRLSAADERLNEYAEASEQVAQALRKQVNSLQEQYNEVSDELEKQKQEKLTALLRNAEISQSEEILKKDLRIERDEVNELSDKVQEMQDEINQKNDEILRMNSKLNELNSVISNQRDRIAQIDNLNTEISEKNKNIKILNQRLVDLKKTLQQEIRNSSSSDLTAMALEKAHELKTNGNSGAPIIMDEVNFKYLKHVIVKFLTSREVEARHLIRAVATLLQLSHEEEKLLHDTLNWKMSWFGTKPDHGTGQRAFSIPPS